MALHFLDNLVFDIESTRKHIIIASLKSEPTCKLINIIAGSRFFISSLPGSALKKHLELLDKPCNATTILEA